MSDTKKRRIIQRNRKPAERAIIFGALVGGLSLDSTRALLEDAGYGDRALPDRSWEILKSAYLPKFMVNPHFLGECIYSPRAMGDFDL